MAIPILKNWQQYFTNHDEGLGSSYERVVLNRKIISVCDSFKAKTVLEVPSFGFTGVSGINSMQIAKSGRKVTLIDHNIERIELIKKIWNEVGLPVVTEMTEDYNKLPFQDKSFDLSWNFSALWFTDNLEKFLSELDRITKKAIFICVPNRLGIGYLTQKYLGREDLKKYLKEENIKPVNIKKILRERNWVLIDEKYIDCPPWPDIGMPKEKFLKIFGLGFLLKNKPKESISILEHYAGKSRDFEERMLHHFWFEKKMPWLVKRFWAHHRYMLFVKK